MQDIRVDDAFFGHPKTVRFQRRTGDQGIACLFRLWCYTSRYFPKGILVGMNPVDISNAAGWKGDPEEFIAALVDAGGPGKVGFIDLCEAQCQWHYGLHNWRKRNPYAYFREERSEVSRRAAEIRWGGKGKTKEKQRLNTKGNANRNANSNAEGNAPSPAPAPIPLNKDLAAPPDGVLEAPPPERQDLPKELQCDTQGCEQRWTIKTVDGKKCRKCSREADKHPERIPGLSKIGAIE